MILMVLRNYIGQGYQSKFSSSAVMGICGQFIYPELNPINLVLGGI